MWINIEFLQKKKPRGGSIRRVTTLLERDEFDYLREKARKNEMHTAQYLYNLMTYAMHDDSWLQKVNE